MCRAGGSSAYVVSSSRVMRFPQPDLTRTSGPKHALQLAVPSVRQQRSAKMTGARTLRGIRLSTRGSLDRPGNRAGQTLTNDELGASIEFNSSDDGYSKIEGRCEGERGLTRQENRRLRKRRRMLPCARSDRSPITRCSEPTRGLMRDSGQTVH